MSIDSLSPYPTLDVLSAVVTAYGVDPTWLITGEYNPSTHRAAEAQPDRALDGMRALLGAMPIEPPTSAAQPGLRLLRDG